ncbi:MAG: hypothetical protein GX677_05985 [Treponema sp.]|nr:hypothetical protein [Treponema sp.]
MKVSSDKKIPLIFLHKGSPLYLQIALRKAKSVCSSDVYLIGDETNNYSYIKHALIKDYNHNDLEKYYKHMSPNGYNYEIFCLQRWFVLKDFCKQKVFIQKFFYYYVNCMSETLWTGTCCAPYGYFTPQEMRDYARFGKLSDEDLIKDGGWHYSYQGGIDRIKQKVINICESYRIIDKIGSTEDMGKKINNGEVLWDPNEKLHYIDFNKGKIEGTFTIKEFIRDNPSFYKEIEE